MRRLRFVQHSFADSLGGGGFTSRLLALELRSSGRVPGRRYAPVILAKIGLNLAVSPLLTRYRNLCFHLRRPIRFSYHEYVLRLVSLWTW